LVDPTATTEVIIPFLAKTQSLDYARGVARDHAQSAMDFTDLLDANEYSASLRLLAEFVLQRTH
jgi:geranylgeranyl pyrophosphate synthase